MSVDVSTLPKTVADAERATLAAINASFTQDGAKLKKHAEDALANTQRLGAEHRAKMDAHMKQLDANGRAFDDHMKQLDANARTFDAHMDNMDRSSKSFQNYIFDRFGAPG